MNKQINDTNILKIRCLLYAYCYFASAYYTPIVRLLYAYYERKTLPINIIFLKIYKKKNPETIIVSGF